MSYIIVEKLDITPQKQAKATNYILLRERSIRFGKDAGDKNPNADGANLVKVQKNGKSYLALEHTQAQEGAASIKLGNSGFKTIYNFELAKQIADFYNINLKGEFKSHKFEIESEANLIVLMHPKKFGE